MNPQTFQQRTDDLYRLQTRDLIYRNVNGSYPNKGAVGYIANTVGKVGWSPVTTDSAGNLTAPGTVSLGLNGALTVDGVTRDVRAAADLIVAGDLNANTVTTNTFNLKNSNAPTQVSNLFVQNDVTGKETLTWSNSSQRAEPISGWSPKLAICPAIFRTVPITPDLSGPLLILTENMNNLLQCFKDQGCFVGTLTPVGEVATVFNTNAAIQVTMVDSNEPPVSASFVYTRTGTSNDAVSYSEIAADLTAAATTANPDFQFNVEYITDPADPLQGSMKITFGDDNNLFSIQFDDAPGVIGGGQLFLNHIGFGSLHTEVVYDNSGSAYPLVVSPLRDFVVLMPPVPEDISGQTITSTTCTIKLPPLPPLTPVPISNICVYWCISGGSFNKYTNGTFVQYIPNAIINDPTATEYVITNLDPDTAYNIAISYRSVTDETLRSSVLYIKTLEPELGPSLMQAPTMNIYSVDITQDVNWISTPSYGTVAPNYTKPYAANVRFNVASVFAAIWTNTLSDLRQISQIQSVTLDFYAGAAVDANASFFINRTAISPGVTEADADDAVGLGGTLVIEKGDPLLSVLFDANDGVINTNQKMSFGWSSSGGGIRNCEMTGFTVVYSV